MKLEHFAFGTTDWAVVPREEKSAAAGQAFWRTQQFGDVRVRMVEYTPGYVSDHWCTKGHVLLCLQGELHTELADGRRFTLTPGRSYRWRTMRNPTVPPRRTGPRCSSWIDGFFWQRFSNMGAHFFGPQPAGEQE